MTAPPPELAEAVIAELRRWRFRLDDEAALQGQIHDKLVAAGFAATREVRLGPADRIDLLVGPEDGPAVGVEVKIKGQRRSIYRQCARYCGHARIGALVVVTNAAMGFPPEIEGKPIFVHGLGKGWL